MYDIVEDTKLNEELTLAKIVSTQKGKIVFDEFTKELSETMDFIKAFDRAAKVAEAQGILAEFQIALIWDLLKVGTHIGSFLSSEWRKHSKSKDNKI